MHNGLRERCLLYYSGLFNPVYELYKLKAEPQYAVQRYCSFKTLSEYKINPTIQDYELREYGFLEGNTSSENIVEKLIQAKNTIQKNHISIGDIINVFRAGRKRQFFVDAVGLKEIEFFFVS